MIDDLIIIVIVRFVNACNSATGNLVGLQKMHEEYELDCDHNQVFVNQRGFDGRTALHLAAAGRKEKKRKKYEQQQ